MLSIPQIITRAQISEYLVVNAITKGGLFGGGIPHYLASLIRQVRITLERMYSLDPTEVNLIGNANYLFTLCGKYGVQASYLISSGGSIPSTSGGTIVYSYERQGEYTATTDGETSLFINLPTGSKVTAVEKGNTPLFTADFIYSEPYLNLLRGVQMTPYETIFYWYVVPL